MSHLDEVKLELVLKATANGKQRATLMVQSSDEKLGTQVSAKQGVIQITKKNSSETSNWGYLRVRNQPVIAYNPIFGRIRA